MKTTTTGAEPAFAEFDVGEYCRQVEAHLTRVNNGHLVRIVGQGFEIVRGWALEGIPLGIVCQGISAKAARHAAGRATRALRLEFCEPDVRALYQSWRRAVGMSASSIAADRPGETEAASDRKPSLGRSLDRAVDRISRIVGQLDLPDTFRLELTAALEQVSALRDASRHTRGDARRTLEARLPAVDARLVAAARAAAGDDELRRFQQEAEDELVMYRGRLTPDVWARSIEVGIARRLREHFGLPTLEL